MPVTTPPVTTLTPTAPTAAALVIGDEILSGKVEEANVAVLARTLRSLGVLLRRVVVVMDDIDAIVREVRELSRRHDWLFTSGGVGPDARRRHHRSGGEGVRRARRVVAPDGGDAARPTTRSAARRVTCEWRSCPRGRRSR